MSAATDVVTIGKVLRPFGVHGDVRVELLSDVPDRFERLPSVTLVMPTGEVLPTEVIQARKTNRGYVVRFSAFSSPEEAAKFRGAFVQVQQESLPFLPKSQYYQFELIGLEVQDETGRFLGILEEVITLPHQHLLVAKHKEDEVLIPAVHAIIRQVDILAGTITVAPFEEWGISNAL